VSVESDPQVNVQLIEETRRQINQLLDEVARLSESNVPPADYYGEFLKRALQGLAAPAGAVWVRTPQGHLQLQHQINLREVGLEHESNRQSHDELLRHAFQKAEPLHVPPHSFAAAPDGGSAAPGNPTDFDVLLVPIVVDQIVTGFVEVWQGAGRNPNAIPGFLQFLKRMAHFASVYARSHKLRQIVGQQELWTQLENFARQVHGSLHPTEVSYLVANEGRRLIECDRVSVGLRMGRKTKIEAISGADVVEKRSNLVQLMRALLEKVLLWGEKLVYSGAKDDTLPPNVLHALDEYLAESNSKFLVALPLKDERESESHKPPRSAILMESFEPNSSPEQLIARLEVVGRHATSALYNAVEHRRIPGRWIWQPLARLQEGLGGKARAIGISIAAAVVVLAAVLTFVPYPLKMEAKGQLLPEVRGWVYSPVEGRVLHFNEGVDNKAAVSEGQPLVLMYDLKLEKEMEQLKTDIENARRQADASDRLFQSSQNPSEHMKLKGERDNFLFMAQRKSQELARMRQRTQSEDLPSGQFWLRSPMEGTILNWGFRETLTDKDVRPSDPLLRIGSEKQRWEIELKIPQKHIGQVLAAFHSKDPDAELDVDVLLATDPTRTFKGKLARRKIGGEASPNRDDANESDPVVWASVRIDGKDIRAGDQIRGDKLVPGAEVHAKIRCGQHAMGYSLFYGLWEFFYEKVVFFF
jgi:hypothetical protein